MVQKYQKWNTWTIVDEIKIDEIKLKSHQLWTDLVKKCQKYQSKARRQNTFTLADKKINLKYILKSNLVKNMVDKIVALLQIK